MNERWLVQRTLKGFAIRSDKGALIAADIIFQDVAEHIVKLHNDELTRIDKELDIHQCGWAGCIEYIRVEDAYCFPHAVRVAMQNAHYFTTPSEYRKRKREQNMEES